MELYVISYDITNNKIRNKLSKLLSGYGKRVQYSVFECHIKHEKYIALFELLKQIKINDETDSIRIYKLCGNCAAKITTIGNKNKEIEILEQDIVII